MTSTLTSSKLTGAAGIGLAEIDLVERINSLQTGLWDTRNVVADGRQIDINKTYLDLAASNPGQFFKTCGDSFVSVIHDGAEIIARLQVDAHSIDEKRTLSASLEGSYAGASLSVQASDTPQTLQTNKKLTRKSYFGNGAMWKPSCCNYFLVFLFFFIKSVFIQEEVGGVLRVF